MTRTQLEVIFCDDVRQEIGNKQSFIGVYSGDLLIEHVPVVLPRLCVVATLTLPPGDDCDSVQFRVMQGDQCLLRTDDLPGASGAFSAEQDRRIAVVAVMSPFQVDDEISLHVVAELDETELESRHLRIRRTSDDLETVQ
ncbi:DUF6941 family protein [Halochromatium salexigens]|uniref:Uncharacterized protein n=1 Tax=Halochromatium salexigens TaxID=49447 RepID=A0AAJ0UIF3_HALSE|nr:hypothetical protein [Halochromatium salexigens]MBK5931102.1 hypothetical protein [Halochromatium salexigens]